jgi:hypothetical protein
MLSLNAYAACATSGTEILSHAGTRAGVTANVKRRQPTLAASLCSFRDFARHLLRCTRAMGSFATRVSKSTPAHCTYHVEYVPLNESVVIADGICLTKAVSWVRMRQCGEPSPARGYLDDGNGCQPLPPGPPYHGSDCMHFRSAYRSRCHVLALAQRTFRKRPHPPGKDDSGKVTYDEGGTS